MDDKVIQTLRNCQLEILDRFVDICESNNLRYYLAYGTLLGAVRHEGYIPWDDDIDVFMPYKDFLKFNEIGQKELGEDFFLQNCETDRSFGRAFSKIRKNNTYYGTHNDKNTKKHHGIFIDIIPLFPYETGENSSARYKIMRFVDTYIVNKCDNNPLSKRYNLLKIFSIEKLIKCRKGLINRMKGSDYVVWLFSDKKYDYDMFRDGVKLLFEGKEYVAPLRYNEILEIAYGSNYMELPPIEKRETHNISFLKIGNDVIYDEFAEN